VNPASGCVPMLLTMPVLFAFYALLSQAVELRGAPFGPWITDLSHQRPVLRDPHCSWGLDVLAAADHAEHRGPGAAADDDVHAGVFTAVFIQFPSGLAILLFHESISGRSGQQYFTNWADRPTGGRTPFRPAGGTPSEDARLRGGTAAAEPKGRDIQMNGLTRDADFRVRAGWTSRGGDGSLPGRDRRRDRPHRGHPQSI
jgi:hypothetical protein